MASLNMDIPHQLPKEEALTRIKKLLGNLKEEQKQYISNVQENWTGDKGKFSFTAKGFDCSGTIQVNDTNVEIDSQVPFAVSLFKGKITSMITEKAKQLLA
jgi:hypothetical protein